MVSERFVNNKKIFVIDYSDQKESAMIADVFDLKGRILGQSSSVLIMSIFNEKSYATPRFMRAAEQATREVMDMIERQALVGLNKPKQIIMMGYSLLFRKSIQNFDSKEEAMKFLLDESPAGNPPNPFF